MDVSGLAQLDLNLLVALHTLLRERHVSRAAARMGVSQPAMSRSLARLREMFDDPLLVRVKSGMDPTARGLELYSRVEGTLEAIQELVAPVRFEPREASGRIRIAAPDILVYILVPTLMRTLAELAPNLDLEWTRDWQARIEDGSIDLAVGFPSGNPVRLYTGPLVESQWMCVLRAGHPALRKKWDLDRFCACDHLLVTLTGKGKGPVDQALAREGRVRRVALRVPYPTLSPLLVAETDLVLTTIVWLARKRSPAVGLVLRRPPLTLPALRAPMVWHERSHRDARQKWFRGLLAQLARDALKPGVDAGKNV